MQVLAPLSSPSSHREAMPCPDAHAPLAGAGNLSKLVECVGLRKPAAGLGGYRASWRDDPPWMLCRPAKARAGLGERRVRLVVWKYGPYGDLWGMAIAYGLAGCETADFAVFCELLEGGGCVVGEHKDPSSFKRNAPQIRRRNDGSLWPPPSYGGSSG